MAVRPKRKSVKIVGVVFAGLTLFLGTASFLRHFAETHVRSQKSLTIGHWSSMPIGYMTAGTEAYSLNPNGTGAKVHHRHDSVTPVTWSQEGSCVTILTHYADGSTMECRFVLSADGKTLRQTDEIGHLSLSQRILHLDFSTEDTRVPISFQKSATLER